MAAYDPWDPSYDPNATNSAPAPPPPSRPPDPVNDMEGFRKLYDEVGGWYGEHLGRAGSHDEILGHVRNPGGRDAILRTITGSPEAAAYGVRRTAQNTATANAAARPPTSAGGDFGRAWLGSGGRTLDDFRRFLEQWNSANPNDRVTAGGSKGDKATYRGRTYDAVIAAGLGGQGASWNDITDGEPGGGGGAAPAGSAATASSVFSDPATTGWEQLLRQLVDRMNVPQPTWTPAQLELQQTQVLDPMERQRQARKQQQSLQLSQRGITPGSGVFESAMRDIDRQFDQARTQTQGAFATRAIDREDQVFQGNEARATNAVNMMQRIPQLADQRLAMAKGTLMDANPYGLLQIQQQIERDRMYQQQYGTQQNQLFLQEIMKYLLPLFE